MSVTAAPTPPPMPVRARLTRRGWALLAAAGLVLVGLLTGVLVVLIAVLGTLSQQRDLTRVLLTRADPSLKRAPSVLTTARPVIRDAGPVLRDARPVLKAARAAIPQARRTARQTQTVLREAAPLLNDLGPVVQKAGPLLDELAPALSALGPTVRGVRAADLPSLIRSARPVLDQLARTNLRGLAANVSTLSSRADRALPAVLKLVTEANQRELLRRLSRTLPMIGSLNQLQKAALSTIRHTDSLTGDIDDLLHQSLLIQQQLLRHVVAIDHKIPGPTGD